MMNANEPTTGEIIEDLRDKAIRAIEFVGNDPRPIVFTVAADRLESQERTIAELTARAESAEAERDAAIRDLVWLSVCKTCAEQKPFGEYCVGCANRSKYKWRGLQPQDGGDV